MIEPPLEMDLRIAQAMLDETAEILAADMAELFDTGLAIILANHMADHIKLSLAAELEVARLATQG